MWNDAPMILNAKTMPHIASRPDSPIGLEHDAHRVADLRGTDTPAAISRHGHDRTPSPLRDNPQLAALINYIDDFGNDRNRHHDRFRIASASPSPITSPYLVPQGTPVLTPISSGAASPSRAPGHWTGLGDGAWPARDHSTSFLSTAARAVLGMRQPIADAAPNGEDAGASHTWQYNGPDRITRHLRTPSDSRTHTPTLRRSGSSRRLGTPPLSERFPHLCGTLDVADEPLAASIKRRVEALHDPNTRLTDHINKLDRLLSDARAALAEANDTRREASFSAAELGDIVTYLENAKIILETKDASLRPA